MFGEETRIADRFLFASDPEKDPETIGTVHGSVTQSCSSTRAGRYPPSKPLIVCDSGGAVNGLSPELSRQRITGAVPDTRQDSLDNQSRWFWHPATPNQNLLY